MNNSANEYGHVTNFGSVRGNLARRMLVEDDEGMSKETQIIIGVSVSLFIVIVCCLVFYFMKQREQLERDEKRKSSKASEREGQYKMKDSKQDLQLNQVEEKNADNHQYMQIASPVVSDGNQLQMDRNLTSQ